MNKTGQVLFFSLLGLACIFLVLKYVPPLLVPESSDSDAARAESARTALVQLLTGGVLLGGVWLTSRTYLLSKQSHRRERFAEAVGMLKEDDEAVRTGGVEILRMLAKENQTFWDPVESVLISFIRGKARRRSRSIPADVIAALETLGARPHGRRSADLSGVHLPALRLQGANLSACKFDYADLRSVVLTDCDLTNASFQHAVMPGARFSGAKLIGTSLDHAKLTGAAFDGAHVKDISVDGADFSQATGGTVEQKRAMLGTPVKEIPVA